MKALLVPVLLELLSLAAQAGALLWLVLGIPWLYAHYGAWGDWWVFVLAMSVFTIALLAMTWLFVRRLRRWRAH